MSKEIVIKEPTALIELAIEKGSDLEKLEKLLNIQREYNKDIARSEYHKAMSAFKAEPLVIKKDRAVSFGQGKASYKHASLFNVVTTAAPLLSKHGLSAAWTTKQGEDKSIAVTCRVTHQLGHFEETTLSGLPDDSGNKNKIQQVGSTVTYLQRYTLLSLRGLATMDQDNDGNSVVTEFISEKEYGQLLDHINNEGLQEEKVCEYLKVEDLRKLPKAELAKAMRVKKAAKPAVTK